MIPVVGAATFAVAAIFYLVAHYSNGKGSDAGVIGIACFIVAVLAFIIGCGCTLFWFGQQYIG